MQVSFCVSLTVIFKVRGRGGRKHCVLDRFHHTLSRDNAVPFQKKKKKLRLISAEGSEPSRLTVHHGRNDVHQTIQSREVTVLSVALHPQRPVCQLFSVREGSRFTKIDHPDFGPSRAVVNKQQGAADHLSRQITKRQTGKDE